MSQFEKEQGRGRGGGIPSEEERFSKKAMINSSSCFAGSGRLQALGGSHMMESAPLACLKSCLPTLQPLSSRPRSSFGFSDIYRCECVWGAGEGGCRCVCVWRRTGCGGGKDGEADAAMESTD